MLALSPSEKALYNKLNFAPFSNLSWIFDIISSLHKAGTTILLVEQNAQAALAVANRGYVLETGEITLTGSGRELLANEAVKKAYLGG